MREIYNQAQKIVSKAEYIEWELRGHNPGTGRMPLSVVEIRDKCIGLQELLADMLDMFYDKINN